MPNHVINELIFRGIDAETQERVLAEVLGSEGKVDFNVLVPAPLNMWWGNTGCNHMQAFKNSHLDWAKDNWGTKWNAYGHEPIERTADTLTLRFQTAWTPPYPWLAAVFNKTRLSFEHNWMSEGGSPAVHGVFDMSQAETFRGPMWTESEADEALARHLHLLLWGVEEFPDDEEVTA